MSFHVIYFPPFFSFRVLHGLAYDPTIHSTSTFSESSILITLPSWGSSSEYFDKKQATIVSTDKVVPDGLDTLAALGVFS